MSFLVHGFQYVECMVNRMYGDFVHLYFALTLCHSMLVAKVMYPANSTMGFSWLTRSTSIFLMKNVQIYSICSGFLPFPPPFPVMS